MIKIYILSNLNYKVCKVAYSTSVNEKSCTPNYKKKTEIEGKKEKHL